MGGLSLTINGAACRFSEGDSILKIALDAGIYVPHLCYHPDLPSPDKTEASASVFRGNERFDAKPLREAEGEEDRAGARESGEMDPTHAGERAWTQPAIGSKWEGCGLCMVEVRGIDGPVRACMTLARDGMEVVTDSDVISELRRRNLSVILGRHPHACLTCAEREGCSRTSCSLNVPVEERCCSLLGKCELQAVAEYVGIPEYTPKYTHRADPVLLEEPLYSIDYNLCIGCTRCVRACNDLRQVEALAYVDLEGRTIVGHRSAGGLKESECRFCGACVEVCPTGALMDKKQPSGKREDWLVPCRSTCPAGVDVPQYIRFIAQGRYDEATAVVRDRAPLPLTLGSACFHPCEKTCRRAELDDPVAICALKRFAAERESAPPEPRAPQPTGRRVAVVGSGPAGLTCAWYLARKGHAVEVFEAEDEPGGMMTQAIPEFRLPKQRVLSEIEHLKKHNVVIKTSFPIEGADAPSYLIDQGYDAVFLAIGNVAPKKIEIPGAEGPGVHWGLQLLRDVKAGNRPPLGDRVIVIGGGNVAVDAAMTALRLGGSEVDMICLEKPEEMPAHTSELQSAMAEGVKIRNSWGPAAIIREDAKVRRVDFIRCTRVFDDSGRFNPKYDSDETYSVECDSVILAIGQEIGDSFRDSALLGEGKLIASDPETCSTAAERVFAGGEATRGPLSIIDAVQDGRRAAAAIDKYLGGDGLFEDESRGPAGPAIGRDEGFSRRRRVPPLSRPAPSREGPAKATADSSNALLGNFAEIEGVLTDEQARYEASRCLQCDLRLQISAITPPPKAGRLFPLTEAELASVPKSEGVYRLYDERGETMKISGSADLKAALQEELAKGRGSLFFDFEEDPMYTKRESELIQQYLQKHGRMPGAGGDDDLDDLF